MKTAIIYYSKHGTTERVAHLIGEKLSPELEYISLKVFHLRWAPRKINE